MPGRSLLRPVRSELRGIHPRLLLARLLMLPLPPYAGGRLRSLFLRSVGFRIGSNTVILGSPRIVGPSRLSRRLVIGEHCYISIGAYFDLADDIVVGNRTTFAPQVMVLTGTHDIGTSIARRGPLTPKPVHIGDGVWLGARCTVLPGVTIGDGVVIAAGAMVTKDIPANSLAAGVPSKIIRQLDESSMATAS